MNINNLFKRCYIGIICKYFSQYIHVQNYCHLFMIIPKRMTFQFVGLYVYSEAENELKLWDLEVLEITKQNKNQTSIGKTLMNSRILFT